MGWVVHDFNVKDGRQTAETLCANAECVDLFVQLDTQFFNAVGWAAFNQFVHVYRCHDGFFGEQHGFFGCAADTDAQNAGRTPACAHGRYGFEYPVNDGVGWIEHDHFGFVFGAATFGCDDDFYCITGDHFDVYDGWGVVFGVLAFACRIAQNGGAQQVVRIGVGATYTFVDHFLDGDVGVPFHAHTDF